MEGRREQRQIAGKAQTEIASALNVNHPSASQTERQIDVYISTLRSYVEAVGRELELTVTMPKRPTLLIHQLGDAAAPPQVAGRGRRTRAQIGGRRGR